ncbi:MAG: sugar isomerase, partial [Cyclobacteriaceae bacterium]
MRISANHIQDHNQSKLDQHKKELAFVEDKLAAAGVDVNTTIEKIKALQIAIPSWALGTGGTRFGRFPGGGEPGSLEEKLDDIGLINALNQSSNAVSLHIPWDVPSDVNALKDLAKEHGLLFDAVNSNTFQDQEDQKESYKFGSLSNIDKKVRDQAIQHNIDVIKLGDQLGSKALTVWLADGSCFPGQHDFKTAYLNTLDSLKQIYKELPNDWKLLVEYKPYEPNFYSTVIQDWGASFNLANKLG